MKVRTRAHARKVCLLVFQKKVVPLQRISTGESPETANRLAPAIIFNQVRQAWRKQINQNYGKKKFLS